MTDRNTSHHEDEDDVMGKIKVTDEPFDAAEFLTDAEAQAAALSDALMSGHKGVILNILNAIARARGMTALARETGVKREALYAALGPNGNPTMETFLAVINALGIALKAEAKEDARQFEPT